MRQDSGSSKRGVSLGANALDPHASGKKWSWVQFFVFFVIGATATFFTSLAYVDDLPTQFVWALIVGGFVGALAGRLGDRVIALILTLLHWSS